ncbi:MAG: HEAT repeat domain-containing protein [Deltaproteobacteria bacterium]|nr:MAG: HEAT repeat domain-containing protein [Deltaproteobacteria bacterium]
MKKFFVFGIVVCLIFSAVSYGYAKMGKEGLRLRDGEFEIPPEIQKAASVSELRPFLDSEDQFTRMAAVRRLGEIEKRKAVSLLINQFEREPYRVLMAPEGAPLVKLEIIRTLERIGGEEAKFALLGILRTYWERGPKVKNRRQFNFDGDYTTVVPLTLKALYKWSQDKDVFAIAKEIALSEDVKKFHTEGKIGENSWKIYLKGNMIEKGILDDKDSARYLLDLVEDLLGAGCGKIGLMKVEAARNILGNELKESALSSLKEELEEEFAKEPRGPKGSFTKRHNKLRNEISYLKRILKRKNKYKKN